MSATAARTIGGALSRVDAHAKVTGAAKYAYEHHPRELAYALIVQAGIARGEVRDIDASTALAVPGVRHVIWAGNAPRLGEDAAGELAVLQSPRVAYRGQIVAIIVADSLPAARQAERAIRIDYAPEPHDVELREDHSGLYTPEVVNPSYASDTFRGDVEPAFAAAAVTVDVTYRTPAEHNNPMEPHATVAVWDGDSLTLHDSNQGSSTARGAIARAFGLEPEQVRVISQHVGGGFGSKGTPRPTAVAAALAARVAGRPVKLAATRQQMFSLTGYRTPTIQRVAIGADAEGHITAMAHDVVEQSSVLVEFAEQTALATRKMYSAPNQRTTHKLARLNVPTPSWMRAPGECPGMFALESAMDELARRLERKRGNRGRLTAIGVRRRRVGHGAGAVDAIRREPVWPGQEVSDPVGGKTRPGAVVDDDGGGEHAQRAIGVRPQAEVDHAAGGGPVQRNSSVRLSTSRTGRPNRRASQATSGSSSTPSLPPNPPPTTAGMTRTCAPDTPRAAAVSCCVTKSDWVGVQTVKPSERCCAVTTCGSMGAWCTGGTT